MGLQWRKSTRSAGNGACVEFAVVGPDAVAVRDSKDRQGPALGISADGWRAFLGALRKADIA